MKKLFLTAFLAVCALNPNAAEAPVTRAELFPDFSVVDINELPLPPRPEYNEVELRHLSAIVFAEAGNQCKAGQQAVGIVVMNRVENPTKFADNIVDVLYEPGQFYPKGSPRFEWALSKYDDGTIPQSCVEAAKYALDGNKTIVYNDQVIDMSEYHYFAMYYCWSDCPLQIQDHVFKKVW